MFRKFVFICLLLFLGVLLLRTFGTDKHDDRHIAPIPIQPDPFKDEQPAPKTQRVELPPIQVTAPVLISDYLTNEIAADKQYRGRRLEVSGLIGRIRKDLMGRAVVELAVFDSYKTVDAYLNDGSVDIAAQLSRGQEVTLTCKGAGSTMGSPVISDCSIQPKEELPSVQAEQPQ